MHTDQSRVEMGRTDVSDAMVAAYRANGFVKVPNLLTAGCAARFREAALPVAMGENRRGDGAYSDRLTQQVNVWRQNEDLAQLTLSGGIAAIAEQLTGCKLRVWHDHLLSKKPNNLHATEWHQDQPFWPLEGTPETISVWIALQDTPADKGCMSFLPQSHLRKHLEAQNLSNSRSLFNLAPELEYEPKVTLPLRAGDATFHNGFTGHMANANQTDDWRIAHVTIYMQDGATYSGKRHVVTEAYKKEMGDLTPGDPLVGTWFPCPTAGTLCG